MALTLRNPLGIDGEQLAGIVPWLIAGAGAYLLLEKAGTSLFGSHQVAPAPPAGTPISPPGTTIAPPPASGPADPLTVVGSAQRRAAIAALYSTLLQRTATQIEISQWDTAKLNLASIEAGVRDSLEFKTLQMVRSAYAAVLGRDPESTDVLRYWFNQTLANKWTQDQLNAALRAASQPAPAPAPGGGTPPPAGATIRIGNLFLKVPPINGMYQVTPGQTVDGILQVQNLTAAPLPYQVQIIWRSDSDGSSNIAGADTLNPNEVRDLTFSAVMPSVPGVYSAFFGFWAGGVMVHDPNQPEGGNWRVNVVTQ